ncbi:hypothetical protein EJV47_06135 [Hymenobacter gummosus]|uniref:Uncharacterized protein n=1 Tax=Hymenobacter gummosus TaxID=1776032 RepID=A0A3S0H6J2_9BACT|nr:hypothetical protein [Hymenobacter gummosus]RTQ51381.1 hypothetical protein EJV47_06135 [Hymenobacter gummosus]
MLASLRRLLGPALRTWLLLAPTMLRAQHVGINTTQPTQPLDVNGNARVRGLANPAATAPQLVRADADGNLSAAPLPAAAGLGAAAALLGQVATDPGPADVAVSGTTAYVASSGSNRLAVYDCANPAAPVLRGQLSTPGAALAVAVSGTTAYVVTYNPGALLVVDCSNPAAPQLRGSVSIGGVPYDVAVGGTTAYVVEPLSNALLAYDCANPASPQLLGSAATEASPQGVTVSGTTVYVANYTARSLQLFDGAPPGAPVLRGRLALSGSPYRVAVDGTTAYLTSYSPDALLVVDCAPPTAPQLLTSLTTDTGTADVALSGPLLAVISYASTSLQAFDRSRPAAPAPLGRATTDGTPQALALSGTTAYVVNAFRNSLQLFRVLPTPAGVVGQNPDGSLSNLPLSALNYWQQSGNYVYRAGGRVGIGTAAPQTTLDVNGVATLRDELRVSGPLTLAGGAWLQNQLRVSGSTELQGSATLQNGLTVGGSTHLRDVVTTAKSVVLDVGDTNPGTVGGEALRFGALGTGEGIGSQRQANAAGRANQYGLDFYTNSQKRLSIANNGNVGVGTDQPAAALDVVGGTRLRGLSTPGVVTTDADGYLSSAPAAALDPTTAGSGLTKTGNNFALGGTLTQPTTLNQGGYALSLTGGYVGIGTAAPQQPLDVAGNIGASGTVAAAGGLAGGALDVSGPARLRGLATAGVVTNQADGTLGTATAAALDPTTATNGLTKTGSAFALGGALSQPTALDLGPHSFRLTNGVGQNVADPAVLGPTNSFRTVGNPGETQTFTAAATGALTQVEVTLSSSAGGRSLLLNVWAGAAGTGTLLLSAPQAFTVAVGGPAPYVFALGGLTLTQGQAYTLELRGAGNLGWAYSSIGPYPNGAAGFDPARDFVFRVTINNAAVLLTAQATGVGIGTATPQAGLHVAGSSRFDALSGAGQRVVTADASGNLSTATATSLDPTTAANGLTKTGNSFALGGTLLQHTTLALGGFNLGLTGGRLGVGTSSPQQALDVSGNAAISGNAAVSGTTALTGTVTTGGSLGVGTSSPAVRLHVAGTAGTPNVRVESLAGSGTRLVTADASGNLATTAAMQTGAASIGTSGSDYKTLAVTFPAAYASAPATVLVTVRNEAGTTYTDTFAVTLRSVSATGFVVNIRREDGGGQGWGQNPTLSWLALP